jgi:hypothetical protein
MLGKLKCLALLAHVNADLQISHISVFRKTCPDCLSVLISVSLFTHLFYSKLFNRHSNRKCSLGLPIETLLQEFSVLCMVSPANLNKSDLVLCKPHKRISD